MEETTTDASFGSRSGVASETGPTNPIEPCLTTVQRVARSVKRRREANQPLGWTGTELLEAGKKFHSLTKKCGWKGDGDGFAEWEQAHAKQSMR
jgi:hypothetical protein